MIRTWSWIALAAGGILALSALAGGRADAATFSETLDAGETPLTALAVPNGTDRIEGTLAQTSRDAVDLYQITLVAGTYDFEVVSLPIGGDSMLYLFDGDGGAMAFDDDSGEGLLSAITGQVLEAGDYYLAMAAYQFTSGALDGAGTLWGRTPAAPAGFGTLAGFQSSAIAVARPYALTISGTTVDALVPLPAGLPLMLAGLGALAVLRRRSA